MMMAEAAQEEVEKELHLDPPTVIVPEDRSAPIILPPQSVMEEQEVPPQVLEEVASDPVVVEKMADALASSGMLWLADKLRNNSH